MIAELTDRAGKSNLTSVEELDENEQLQVSVQKEQEVYKWLVLTDLLSCADIPKVKTLGVKTVLVLSYGSEGWCFGHNLQTCRSLFSGTS